MSNTLKELREQSAQIEKLQVELTRKISALEEAGREPEAPWYPKGGHFLYTGTLCVEETFSSDAGYNAPHGCVFLTREDAVKASKVFVFYQRLFQLALECNAKHTPHPTGRWEVRKLRNSHEWGYTGLNDNSLLKLFTSVKAVQEAAEIMTRDRWVLPWV